MAAILERNDSSGKPTILPSDLSNRVMVSCDDPWCRVSYTLAYGCSENRIEKGQNVLDLMSEKARELVTARHSEHNIDVYVWGGVENGWLEREQATTRGL